MPTLSTDLTKPDAIPYFLWDEPITVQELRTRLRMASRPERLRLLAKILREARDTEVWLFMSPDEVARSWCDLAGQLGRRRPFWEFLLEEWRRQGLLGTEPSR
jgi:hypothetical protein